jgi:sugar lactone lactonase YvrE
MHTLIFRTAYSFFAIAALGAAGCDISSDHDRDRDHGHGHGHGDGGPPPDASQPGDGGASIGALSKLAQFDNVPVGVAVSRTGRIFLSFSRAIDEREPYSLAELVGQAPVLFPPGFRQDGGVPAPDKLLSVQALTVDALDRLWILDTAKVGQAPIVPGTPKLVAVDLQSNKPIQTIFFPPSVAGPSAMLNDVRIDLGKGKAGTAFLTDSSSSGPNGLVVVDLATGTATRRLNDHPTTKPQPGLVTSSEGQPLIVRQGPEAGQANHVGSDGIALDADGHHLYYRPLTSHHLYRVTTDALVDASMSDAAVAAAVEDLGDLGFASDGLLGDAQGRLYLTDYEHNAIHRRNADGTIEILAQDDQLLWPDSMSLRGDGMLLCTATQIERSPRLRGTDQRVRPFTVWQVATDGQPLYLTGSPRP